MGRANRSSSELLLEESAPASFDVASKFSSYSDKRSGRVILPEGRAISYKHWPGSGEPIVLVHGLMDSAEGWENLVPHLEGRPIYAFDLPGFGDSDKGSDISAEGYAKDLASAMDVLEINKASLVGHSLGGAVASAMADLRPELFSNLSLLAPAGFRRNPLAALAMLPGFSQGTKAVLPLLADKRFLVDGLYRTMVSAGRPIPSEVHQRFLDDISDMEAADGVEAVWKTGKLHRSEAAYKGPVSVLWGSQDRLVPASHKSGVREAYPHSHIETWDGMGHHPQIQEAKRLGHFLSQSAQSASSV